MHWRMRGFRLRAERRSAYSHLERCVGLGSKGMNLWKLREYVGAREGDRLDESVLDDVEVVESEMTCREGP